MRITLGGIVVLVSLLPAGAQAQDTPPASLQGCTQLKDPMERVRCYDAQVAAMSPQPPLQPPAAPPPAPPSPVAAAPLAPAPPAAVAVTAPHEDAAVAKFGAETLPAAARPAEERKDLIVSNITALNRLGQMRYAISLANGQIWRQKDPDTASLFFHVGDAARIERGSLGSYHLSTNVTGKSSWVQVIRIQ